MRDTCINSLDIKNRGRAGKLGRVGKTGRRPCGENHKSCDADFLAQTSYDVA